MRLDRTGQDGTQDRCIPESTGLGEARLASQRSHREGPARERHKQVTISPKRHERITGNRRAIQPTASRGIGPDRRPETTQDTGPERTDTRPEETEPDRILGYRGVPYWRAHPQAAPNGDWTGAWARVVGLDRTRQDKTPGRSRPERTESDRTESNRTELGYRGVPDRGPPRELRRTVTETGAWPRQDMTRTVGVPDRGVERPLRRDLTEASSDRSAGT